MDELTVVSDIDAAATIADSTNLPAVFATDINETGSNPLGNGSFGSVSEVTESAAVGTNVGDFCKLSPGECFIKKDIPITSDLGLKLTTNEIIVMNILSNLPGNYNKYFSNIKAAKLITTAADCTDGVDNCAKIYQEKGYMTLASYMKAFSNIDLKIVMKIMLKLSKAVSILHACGFCHYDIKPANVIISIDESTKEITDVKLIDFGTTMYIKDNKMHYLEKDGTAYKITEQDMLTPVGTVTHMAPEVMRQTVPTLSSDIWSLGVIFIELICKMNIHMRMKKHDKIDAAPSITKFKEDNPRDPAENAQLFLVWTYTELKNNVKENGIIAYASKLVKKGCDEFYTDLQASSRDKLATLISSMFRIYKYPATVTTIPADYVSMIEQDAEVNRLTAAEFHTQLIALWREIYESGDARPQPVVVRPVGGDDVPADSLDTVATSIHTTLNDSVRVLAPDVSQQQRVATEVTGTTVTTGI